MYIMKRSLFLFSICTPKNIKNIHFPACNSCIHYRQKDSIKQCVMFGEKNVVSNEIDYDSPEWCRRSEDKCGVEGKYFEELPQERKIVRDIITKISEKQLYILFFTIYIPLYVITFFSVYQKYADK